MRVLTFSGRTAKEILRDPLNLAFGLGFPLVLMLSHKSLLASTSSPRVGSSRNNIFGSLISAMAILSLRCQINGAGKTTTIKMLSCLTRPTGGDAILLGSSIVRTTAEVKNMI